MSNSDRSKAVDRPSRVAIARHFARDFGNVVEFEGDAGNYERHQLQQVAKYLGVEPPDIAMARQAAEDGVSHAWRGIYNEDRAEAWACALVAELLRD